MAAPGKKCEHHIAQVSVGSMGMEHTYVVGSHRCDLDSYIATDQKSSSLFGSCGVSGSPRSVVSQFLSGWIFVFSLSGVGEIKFP